MVNKKVQYRYFPISQKSTGNQTMKFGQLIEYNMRKETIPRPLSKKLKLSISLEQ